MLARYQMIRGKRPPESPLPDGLRVDIRKHTRHVLAPAKEDVERYLAAPTEAGFERFKAAYLTLIEARFKADPAPFAALAAEAVRRDVYLGCSCPTAKVPDVRRCHTTLALEFMQSRFPELTVCMPSASR
ncbi:MAG: hypothetical protein KF915_18280 [Polyangiaceae bacterium]|nr:hypothetical protein [Polyangiaceae bacterium]